MHLCNAWKLLPALAAACSAQGLLADRPLELVGRGGQAEVYKTTLPIAVKVVRGSTKTKCRRQSDAMLLAISILTLAQGLGS